MFRHVCCALALALALGCASSASADTAALLNQAVQDYQFQDFKEAKSKLQQVLKAEPDNMMAHYYMGLVLQQTGEVKEAVHHLEIVAKSDVAPEGIEGELAAAYLAAGQPQQALPYYRRHYQANPEDETVAFQYASSLQGIGDNDAAAAIYRKLIKAKGQYTDAARFQLGQIMSSRGAYVSAVDLMRAINPQSPYGGVASSYIEALAPMTRPISIYASAEYFHNSNPSSASARTTQAAGVAGSSHGLTLIGSIGTRAWEMSDRAQAKLSYLYYATFYTKDFAKDNNFVGHFINPLFSYHPNASTKIDLKGEAQFFYFNQQRLSSNFGGTLTGTWTRESGQSANLHGGYLKKLYTGTYVSTGGALPTTLRYLDANSWSMGAGATLLASAWGERWADWGGNLLLDYTFTDERTLNANAAGDLGIQARDSRYRQHALNADVTVPLTGILSRLSILGTVNYLYQDYLNTQSSLTYASAAGSQIKAISLTGNVKLQALLWKKLGLNLAVGIERSRSRSLADTLNYEANRYFGQLSGAY